MLYRKRETQWIQLLLFLLTFSLLFTSSIAGPLIGGRGNPSKKIQKETSKAQAGLEELVNELMKVPHGRHSTTTKTNQHKTMLEDKIIKNHPLGAKTLLSSSSKTTISTIRLPLEGSPSHLNPCDIGSYADRILNRMFDPLVIPSPHDPLNITKYVPVMLKAFTEETLRDYTVETLNGTIVGPEDMTRWNLTLREYTWHDGVALTADDLVFSYQFQKWITTNADSYNLDEYYGPNKMNYLTVTRINNTTVSVYLNQTAWYKKRNALFIPVFPEHIYGHADTWTNQTGTFNTSNWWEPRWHVDAYDVVAYKISGSDDPILTGSGPWRLTDFNAEIPQDATEFSFQRYGDYYWDPYDANGVLIPGREPLPEDESRLDLIFNPEDPYFWGPYADQLEYHVLNETEEWNAFGDDTIILIDGHAVLNHTNNISAAGYPLITGQDNDIGGFSIQCNATYLTRQQKFRLALAYAIDKQNITDTVYSGYATPIDHPVSTAYDEPWYWDPEDNGYTDLTEPLPSEARDLIASLDQVNDTEETYLQGSPNATWTDSDGNVMVTHDYRTGDPLALEMAELIQGDLKDAGIKVELRGMSWGELVGNLLGGSFMLSQHGWSVGGLPLFDLFWNESAYYSVYQWDHPESYYVNTYKFLNARTQDEAVPAARKCQEDLYFGQPFLTIEADQVVETYRISKWRGIVFSVMGGLTADSYRKMALVVGGKGLNYAEGFDHPDGMEVSGTFTFNGSVAVESPLPATIAEIWIDDQDSTYVTMNNETAREILGNIWSISYEVDTTELANGWHTFHYDVLTEELVDLFPASHFALSFYVDNPVPLTQQTLAMAAISGVVGAVVVGAVVYMVMRRRRPPAE